MEQQEWRTSTFVTIVRLVVGGLGLGMLVWLTKQLTAGAITMGTEWPNENITVTSKLDLAAAFAMWGGLFMIMLLWAINPSLFFENKPLFFALLAIMIVGYLIIGIRFF